MGRFALALDAFRRGDWQSASNLAEQLSPEKNIATGFQMAALSRLSSEAAKAKYHEETRLNPDLMKTWADQLIKENVRDAQVQVILDGIEQIKTRSEY